MLGELLSKKPKKTLYLHIGHFKTGTTALQLFLQRNAEFLAQHDMEYATVGRHLSKHSALAFSILRAAGVTNLMHGYSDPATPQEIWNTLFEYVRASEHSKVLVSSEEFMRIGGYPKAIEILEEIAKLGSDIDIRVIAYLRQPKAHLQSWYNQMIKMDEPVLDFDDTVFSMMEEVHFDYALALKPWVEIFGPKAVIVRPYLEGYRETNALYAEFLSAMGVDLPKEGVRYPAQDPNPRLSADRLALAQMITGANLPKRIAASAHNRAQKLLDAQKKLSTRPAMTRQDVENRTANGLKYLQDLPGNSVDVRNFGSGLEFDESPELKEARQLAKYLLVEIHTLRKRLKDTENKINARLQALEDSLSQDIEK